MSNRARQLIVNADGYGFTEGINRGVEETVAAGTVTSISVNANFDPVWQLRDFAQRHPGVSVGVHLNPVVGRPIADPADVPSLVDTRGELLHDGFGAALRSGRIDRDELRHELSLQIDRVRSLVPEVTHVDSHQNRHLSPRLFGLFIALARDHGIARMRTHDHWIGVDHPGPRAIAGYYARHPRSAASHAYARALMTAARRRGMRMCDRLLSVGLGGPAAARGRADTWLAAAQRCPAGTNEIYCHPAYVDDDLRRYAKVIVDQREDERRALLDERVRRAFDDSGVELISFRDV